MTRTNDQDALVLLIDDDSDIQAAVSTVLEMEGVRVWCAATAEEALFFVNQVPTETVDLILLDLNLPDRNGADLLVEIRSHSRYSHVPVVVFSAESRDTDRIPDASDILTKPFEIDRLLSIVKRYSPGNQDAGSNDR